jgi:predicted Fe-Mo cluster-binding NifX family protein
MKFTLLFTFMIMMPWISPAKQDINNMTRKAKIVAIPASEKSIDALMDQSFSRCSFFCLYNTKTDRITFTENKHKSASGGASQLVVQFLVDNGVNEIYAVQVGQNAKMNLDKFKIRTIIVAPGKTISQLINSIKDK